MVRNQGRVTRFVVMAMLQAARAFSLGLPRESAYSWGLNRAIFFAAAKRGFKEGGRAEGAATGERSAQAGRPVFRLGSEEAYRDPKANGLVFTIGGESQRSADFERQVSARFGTPENFRSAWEEALRIVHRFDRATLESQRLFYDEVYRPRRDQLSDEWTQKYSPPPEKARGEGPPPHPRNARPRGSARAEASNGP
jgi:hypothetical protein